MLSSTNGKQASGRCAKLPFDCPCIPPHTAVPNRAVSCHVRLTPKKEERKKTKARRSRGARHVHVLYHAMQQRPFRSRLNRLPSRCSIDAFHLGRWTTCTVQQYCGRDRPGRKDGDGRREASVLGDVIVCMCVCMGAPPSAHTTLTAGRPVGVRDENMAGSVAEKSGAGCRPLVASRLSYGLAEIARWEAGNSLGAGGGGGQRPTSRPGARCDPAPHRHAARTRLRPPSTPIRPRARPGIAYLPAWDESWSWLANQTSYYSNTYICVCH